MNDLIKQLRDIHYPPAISFWPPAIGWYLVAAIVFSLLFIVIYRLWLSFKHRRLKTLVLAQLEHLQKEKHILPNCSEKLSVLLKRSALAIYPREEIAGLYGEQWLEFLDKTSMSKNFTTEIGRLLIKCPYQSKAQELPDQLFQVIKQWVKINL